MSGGEIITPLRPCLVTCFLLTACNFEDLHIEAWFALVLLGCDSGEKQVNDSASVNLLHCRQSLVSFRLVSASFSYTLPHTVQEGRKETIKESKRLAFLITLHYHKLLIPPIPRDKSQSEFNIPSATRGGGGGGGGGRGGSQTEATQCRVFHFFFRTAHFQ